MKNTVKVCLAMLVVVVMCMSCITSCGGNGDNNDNTSKKITESEIRSEMADSDGTLTIEGDSDDVISFNYVVSDINASKLVDKSFTQNAVNVLMNDSSKLVYGQYKVCKAFNATMKIVAMFRDDSGDFDAEEFVSEILGIICDGNNREYNGWTISATVSQENDTITIYATSK